jgi:hypothetical protein
MVKKKRKNLRVILHESRAEIAKQEKESNKHFLRKE